MPVMAGNHTGETARTAILIEIESILHDVVFSSRNNLKLEKYQTE
jgi:hypothetical protein